MYVIVWVYVHACEYVCVCQGYISNALMTSWCVSVCAWVWNTAWQLTHWPLALNTTLGYTHNLAWFYCLYSFVLRSWSALALLLNSFRNLKLVGEPPNIIKPLSLTRICLCQAVLPTHLQHKLIAFITHLHTLKGGDEGNHEMKARTTGWVQQSSTLDKKNDRGG